MERRVQEGLQNDAEGNVFVSNDSPEPEFKKRLDDEDDLFDNASDIVNESSTSISSSVYRIPNFFYSNGNIS